MAGATIGSILLSSTDPERLREWYVAVLEPEVDSREGDYDVLGLGGFWLMLDCRSDVGPKNPEPGRVIINVEVEDARAVAQRVDSCGTPWLAPLEDRDGSFFATAIDPDGNYVQFVQLSPEHRAAMES